MSSSPPLPSLPNLTQTRVCGECGGRIGFEDSIVINGVALCPTCKPVALAKLQCGQTVGDSVIWREKRTLVIGSRAVLPDRCVKCNGTTDGQRLARTLYWHTPWLYILLLPGVLFYVIGAVIARKTAKIQVGLCDVHRASRRNAIIIGWSLFLGGILAIYAGAANDLGSVVLAGVAAILTGIIWGIAGSRVVYARRIDKNWTRAGGAGAAFLDSLPEFPKA